MSSFWQPEFPSLRPPLVDPSWFRVDEPVDVEAELTALEKEHEARKKNVAKSFCDIPPIGKCANALGPGSGSGDPNGTSSTVNGIDDDDEEDDDEEDDDDDDDDHDDSGEDDDVEMVPAGNNNDPQQDQGQDQADDPDRNGG